jgi:hypothetical protein
MSAYPDMLPILNGFSITVFSPAVLTGNLDNQQLIEPIREIGSRIERL